MKKLIYCLLFIVPLVGCELGVAVDESTKGENVKLEETKYNLEQEGYKVAEIFSHKTAKAEFEAIENGYKPEIGVEKRSEILKHYLNWSEQDIHIAVGFVMPIDDLPKPVCPPRPRGDCKYPRILLDQLRLLVYCENPKAIDAAIETKGGVLAELSDVQFDEEFNEAVLSFEVVNPKLLGMPAKISVRTIATIDGEPGKLQVNAAVAKGILE